MKVTAKSMRQINRNWRLRNILGRIKRAARNRQRRIGCFAGELTPTVIANLESRGFKVIRNNYGAYTHKVSW